MKTKIKNEDGITIFLIDGDIDCFTVPELSKVFKQELDRELRNVLVDLSDVTYLDSSAIGFFVNTHKGLEKKGHKLGIVNPNSETMQLLKLTYIDHILDVYSSYNEV